MKKRIAVIGGGASGLMAAIAAKSKDNEVILIEKNDKLGKKLYATGNGRCNFTNLDMSEDKFRTDSQVDFYHVIDNFNFEKTLDFFLESGLKSKERNGYVYPYNDQASAVVKVLELKVRSLGIKTFLNTEVIGISKSGVKFYVQTGNGDYDVDNVIVATGLKASPVTGSDGKIANIISKKGISFQEIVPSLVALRANDPCFKDLAGIRCNGKISIYVDDRYIACDEGEIQLTRNGPSGIPTFQVSRYAAKALQNDSDVYASLDFFTRCSKRQFVKDVKKCMIQLPEYSVTDYLEGMLNSKLVPVILKRAGVNNGKKLKDLSDVEITNIAQNVKYFNVDITDTLGFESAQVCAGGIDLNEINLKTMEFKSIKGMYACGEILDVDGICGGYNLQWAWSTGYLAGASAARSR